MQIQSYQHKMLEYVEKYSVEDLNWKQSEVETSTYERFFETTDDPPSHEGSGQRIGLWLLNVLVYMFLFRFFFGTASMMAFVLPIVPLGIVITLVSLFKMH